MYLENPDFVTFNDISLTSTGAGCIIFNQTGGNAEPYNYGDSLFSGMNHFRIDADNGIGLYVTRDASTTKTINSLCSTGVITFFQYGRSNTTGIWAEHLLLGSFKGIAIESIHHPIYADYCEFSTFEGLPSYLYTTGNDAVVTTTANSVGNTFKQFFLTPSANARAFADACVALSFPNVYENWQIKALGGVNVNNTVTIGTVIRNIYRPTDYGGTFAGFSGSPVGYIAKPIQSMANVLDFGGDNAWTDFPNITFTVYGSPKTIFCYGGTLINCTLNGQIVFTTTPVTVHVVAGDTIAYYWASIPTINVFGE